jgi:hypothetical protein
MPLIASVPSNLTGGANLKSPRGGFANGMPRYSVTVVLEAGWPVTGPLVVLMLFGCFEARDNAMHNEREVTLNFILTVMREEESNAPVFSI